MIELKSIMEPLLVNLVGPHNVGKTTYIDALCSENKTENKTVTFIRDEGEYTFRIIESNEPRPKCDVYMIMFDVTDEASYHAACKLLNQIEETKVLVGNKSDLSDQKYPEVVLDLQSKSVVCKTFYGSAKECLDLSQPFHNIIDTLFETYITFRNQMMSLRNEKNRVIEEMNEEEVDKFAVKLKKIYERVDFILNG